MSKELLIMIRAMCDAQELINRAILVGHRRPADQARFMNAVISENMYTAFDRISQHVTKELIQLENDSPHEFLSTYFTPEEVSLYGDFVLGVKQFLEHLKEHDELEGKCCKKCCTKDEECQD